MATRAAKETATAADVAAPCQQQQQETSPANAVRKWTSSYKHESKLTIEKVWAVGGDFTSINKWRKGITTCDIIGDPTQPGCLRRCKVNDVDLGFGENLFLVEKLLVLNNEEHMMQYSLLENFLGFKEYVGTFKVEPANHSPTPAESDGVSKGGCTVIWSMEVAPVNGKTKEEIIQFSRMMCNSALNGLEALASIL